jgi:hypothetical protein
MTMARVRLLVFDPDQTLSDGAAEVATDGFFDVDNVPPWDTWAVWGPTSEHRGYLLCLIPERWTETASTGILVNPEGASTGLRTRMRTSIRA